MTRKEFFNGNATWKGAQLRALVDRKARRMPYEFCMFHAGVSSNSPEKHLIASFGMCDRAKALANALTR